MFNSKKTLSNIFILSIIIVTLLSSCTEKTHDDNISVNGSYDNSSIEAADNISGVISENSDTSSTNSFSYSSSQLPNEKHSEANVGVLLDNEYVNSEYGFTMTMPDYWINRTVIIQSDVYDDNVDSTNVIDHIIFYNKYLYDNGDLSSAFLFWLEIYDVENFDESVLQANPSAYVLLKSDKYVIIAVKRTGAGIIDNEIGAEQWKEMDSGIDDVFASFSIT